MLIKEILNYDELLDSFELMKQLRTELTKETYINLVNEMRKQGYQLKGLYNDNLKIVSLVGFSILANLYYLKHIWIYDLVTDQMERSKGYGERLIKHVEQIAIDNDCYCIALSSGIERSEAHRFYQGKLEYDKPSYVFKKILR